jgi:hypothetical protein
LKPPPTFFSPSGPATGLINGLHPKSKFNIMPTKQDIAPKVIEILTDTARHFGTIPNGGVKQTHSLSGDLNLSPIIIKALAVPYSKISRSYEGGLRVSQDDASKVKKASDAITLVLNRANGISI